MKKIFTVLVPLPIFIVLIILSGLIGTTAACANEHPHLVFTTADDQTHKRAKIANAVVTDCFERLGMSIDIVHMPSKRSLHNANSGEQDGNFLRTEGISDAYPNLVQVPEPLSQNVIVAFSTDTSILVRGWKSLLHHHVAWVNGWRNCERELQYAAKTTTVTDEATLFRFLSSGRAEVGVFGLETGIAELKRLGITNVKPLTPPIVVSDLYLYLNKRHEQLIERIVQTLQQMKADGTYDAIRQRFEDE